MSYTNQKPSSILTLSIIPVEIMYNDIQPLPYKYNGNLTLMNKKCKRQDAPL